MTVDVKPLLLASGLAAYVQVDSIIAAFMQMVTGGGGSASPIPDGWAQTVEHLTLTTALVIAVAILWKSLVAKDQALIASTKTVTDALSASAASNVELRKIIQDSVDAKISLAATLGDLQRSLERLSDQRTAK